MKKPLQTAVILSFIACIVCFLGVWLFTQPAWLNSFNLSKTSSIGDTIGGITAPIMGLFSSVLLFLALMNQTESSKEQREKNEIETIFLFYNAATSELTGFATRKTEREGPDQRKVERVTYGLLGMYEWAHFVRDMKIAGMVAFEEHAEADFIIQIIKSFEMTRRQVAVSNLSKEQKKFFNDKLDAWDLDGALEEVCKFFGEQQGPKLLQVRKYLDSRVTRGTNLS